MFIRESAEAIKHQVRRVVRVECRKERRATGGFSGARVRQLQRRLKLNKPTCLPNSNS